MNIVRDMIFPAGWKNLPLCFRRYARSKDVLPEKEQEPENDV